MFDKYYVGLHAAKVETKRNDLAPENTPTKNTKNITRVETAQTTADIQITKNERTEIAIEIEVEIDGTSKDLTEIKKEIVRGTEKEVTNIVLEKISLSRRKILTIREGVRLSAFEEMTLLRPRRWRVS